MENNRAFVIAISAVSGGGKTTVINQLNKKLNNSRTLFFDDYDFDGPDDICDWVTRGADYNEWDLAPLINDLNSLLSNPGKPLDYILLDYPFAYKHKKMSGYINFTIFVDTPLDIAMARRILRDFKGTSSDNILKDLDFYLSRGRIAYLEAINSIKPDSDFIIDGSSSTDALVNKIYERIMGNCKI